MDVRSANRPTTLPNDPPRLLSVEELARKWSLRPATVRAWLRRGRLRGYKVGASWRLDPRDLNEFLDRGRCDTDAVDALTEVLTVAERATDAPWTPQASAILDRLIVTLEVLQTRRDDGATS